MDKFELYERLWQEISEGKSFLPDEQYTEKEYQIFKALFEQNLSLTVFLFKEYQAMNETEN